MKSFKFWTIVFTSLIFALPYFAIAKPAKITQSSRTTPFSPSEQQASFKLPEGFVIELVASEKDGIINPIDLTFDDAGRLWTQTAKMYPLDPGGDKTWRQALAMRGNPKHKDINERFDTIEGYYEGRVAGIDQVLILNTPHLNKTNVHVWAEGLAIPQSILPYKNGAYIAHGKEMIFLEDTNGDGKADSRKTILNGFGYTDSHTMSHLLTRAPGGWINFSHGAMNKGLVTAVASNKQVQINYCKIGRFSTDGQKLELVNSGLNNIWGYQLRGTGQWFGSEANDFGFSAVPMEGGSGFNGIGSDKLRSYQPWIPSVHKFRSGGTGLSGLAFTDDESGSFPSAWKDVAFLANPITNQINCVKVVRLPDGSVESELLPNLLESKDDWFRPVNLTFGPDGCLYIADWYNKVISHNELPRSHPDRDKLHGRIWRIRHVSQTQKSIPNFYERKTESLAQALNSPSIWEKRAAWHQIEERQATSLIPELKSIVNDGNLSELTRVHALWSLESLKAFDLKMMQDLLKTKEPHLRREAVRALPGMTDSVTDLVSLLKPLTSDKNVMVRSQVLRSLNDIGKANLNSIDLLVSFCKPALYGPKGEAAWGKKTNGLLGGTYERLFERYLARKALEQYPSELKAYLESDLADTQPISNKIWAAQALSDGSGDGIFLSYWNQNKIDLLDSSNFIYIAKQIGKPSFYNTVQPAFAKPSNMVPLLKLALDHQSEIASNPLKDILQPTVNLALKSDQVEHNITAMKVIKALSVKYDSNLLVAMTKSNQPKLQYAAIDALAKSAKENLALFESIAKSDDYSFDIKVIAIKALATASPSIALSLFKDLYAKLADIDKSKILNSFVLHPKSSQLILNAVQKKVLPSKDLNLDMAEKIKTHLRRSPQAKNLFKQVTERESKQKGNNETLHKFMRIAKEVKGNPKNGKITFTALCLSCHAVGGQGAGFAPPLDGSAHRETEALLTSILDPDAAVESNYNLFRITKKDKSIVEGYCEKRDDKGTTLRFMGGGKLFVPATDISKQDFVSSRSVMPKGLIENFSETQVADLLAYIGTLK